MKRILISTLALIALAACSKNESAQENTLPDGSAPIVLRAGVATVQANTKAPVNTDDTFTAGIAGWETSGTVDYTATASWNTTAANITAKATAESITLTATQTYNADNAIKTYIQAWHPAGTFANGVVTFENTEGTTDAMLATAINGSKSDRDNKTLAFAHKTTQLKFVVKAGDGLATGTTLTSIVVKSAQLPTGFTLSDNTVSYAAAANLTVPGITAGNLTIGTTAAGDAAGNAVMIKPMTGKKVTLDITTSTATFTDVEATIADDENFVEGKAYTITLTFGQKSVALSATVTAWSTGTGTGSVE